MKKIVVVFLGLAVLAVVFFGLTRLNVIQNIVPNIFNPAPSPFIEDFKNAKTAFDKNDFAKAASLIDAIPDASISEIPELKSVPAFRTDVLTKWKQAVMTNSNKLVVEGKYSAAVKALKQIWQYTRDDTKLEKLIDTYTEFSKTVPYNGPVEHIFFHTLMNYSKIVSNKEGYDNWMVQGDEYLRTLQQFYKKDYVLIDIHLLYGTLPNGNVYKKDLKLPAGKKPLVFSLDDYNFLTNDKLNGSSKGLGIVDGKVLSYDFDSNGKKVYSDDKEITPMLDKFVEENPDFSYRGAKGIIALEGFEGSLGFPTNELDSKGYKKALSNAVAVADKLKATGWLFASHSYGHIPPHRLSTAGFYSDANRWKSEVGKIVGKTDIYIYPFGEMISSSDPKFQYLLKLGFRIFCGVEGNKPFIGYYTNYIHMSRRNIDGVSLRSHWLSNIINDKVIPGKFRPWYNSFIAGKPFKFGVDPW